MFIYDLTFICRQDSELNNIICTVSLGVRNVGSPKGEQQLLFASNINSDRNK